MNIDLKLFSRLTEAVYSTALDDSRWNDLFAVMHEAVKLEHFVVQGFDNQLQSRVVADLYGYEDSFAKSYVSHYWKINPWLPGIGRAPIGKAVGAEVYYPEADLRKTEFYNDFIRLQDDVGTGGSVILFRDEHRFLSVGGNIKFSQRDNMLADWLDFLDLLAPHLRNAFELRRQLSGTQLKDVSYLAALDTILNAVFLINAKGQVAYANKSAQGLLKRGGIVSLDKQGGLRPEDPKAARALDKALYNIGLQCAVDGDARIVIQARDGQSKTIATVAPFTPDPAKVDKFAAFAAGDAPVAILTIAVSDNAKPPVRDVLSALYRLTPSESDLALALFAGESLYEYADRREVSRHTVRNQLRKVFEKTETRRQAELVLLLSRYS